MQKIIENMRLHRKRHLPCTSLKDFSKFGKVAAKFEMTPNKAFYFLKSLQDKMINKMWTVIFDTGQSFSFLQVKIAVYFLTFVLLQNLNLLKFQTFVGSLQLALSSEVIIKINDTILIIFHLQTHYISCFRCTISFFKDVFILIMKRF